MNDDALPLEFDEHELLALDACLAGVADAEQRTLVDASPVLQVQLTLMGGASVLIGMVTSSPTASVRDRALAAAMSVFDTEIATPGEHNDAVSAPVALSELGSVVSFTQRHRSRYRMLMAAAAAVVVLGVGGVVLRATSDNATPQQADTASVTTGGVAAPGAEAKATTSPVTHTPLPLTDGAQTATEAAAADAAADDVGPVAGGAAPVEAPAPAGAPAPADTAGGSAYASTQPTIGSIGGPGSVSTDISSPEELASYVANVAPLADLAATETITVESGVPAPSERRLCATDGVQIIGQITYRGTPAVAARLLASGTAVALALDTCRPLAEAPAP